MPKMKSTLSCAAVALLPLAGAVMAQGTDAFETKTQENSESIELEEVFVTARKRDERLIDVPLSITAITGEKLQGSGINNLQDIAKIVPGLTFDRSVSQNDFRPALRGLQAEEGRNGVGLLIDDIDLSSQNLQTSGGGSLARLRLADIERVEVVKGPQAALYGRSAFGGAINYITKRPSLSEVDGSVSVDYNEEESGDIKGSIGLPLIEDHLGVRLNAYYFDDRGSFKNQQSGDYIGGGDGYGLAGSFLFEPNESMSFYGRVEYSDETYEPQAAFVQLGNTDVELDENAQVVLGRSTARIFTGSLDDANIRFDINPRTGKDYPGIETKTLRTSLVFDWDLGDVGIKSLTSFVDNEDRILQDNDFVSGSVDGMVTGAFQETQNDKEMSQFSQEFRVFSQTDSPLQWLLGGLYWEEEGEETVGGTVGMAFRGAIFDSDVAHLLSSRDDDQQRDIARDTEHKSIFGWAEYEVADSLFASAEFRYTKEEIAFTLDYEPSSRNFFLVSTTGGETPPVLIPAGGVFEGFHRETIEEEYFTPRFALSYRPSDHLNIYASVAKSVKPSGYQSGSVFTLDRPFDRENLWAYELGAKTVLLDGTLALNTALFYQDYTDQQVSSQILNPETNTLQPVIENAGESTIWGLEVEVNWRPTASLTLTGAYTYVDAEFEEFEVVSTSRSRIAESGCSELLYADTSSPACLLVKDGNKPADSPEHQLNLGINYTAKMDNGWEWFTDTTARYTSDRYISTANIATQEAYWRVDTQLGFSNDNVRVSLYINNLLDDDTVTDGNLYVDFFNGFAPAAFGYRPAPRTGGIRISYSI